MEIGVIVQMILVYRVHEVNATIYNHLTPMFGTVENNIGAEFVAKKTHPRHCSMKGMK
jgi:hypothetical protein